MIEFIFGHKQNFNYNELLLINEHQKSQNKIYSKGR